MRRRRNRRRYAVHKKDSIWSVDLVKAIIMWTFQIVIVLCLSFLLVFFVGEQINNIGDSMSPTLENNDVVLVNRFIYKVSSPKRGDLIVFKPNGNSNSHFYIKRVIGEPGDIVQIKDGFLYVNEEMVTDLPISRITNPGVAAEEIRVSDDSYFVLGDNPNSSEDSRYADIGNIQRQHIEGKAWYILKPKDRRGGL